MKRSILLLAILVQALLFVLSVYSEVPVRTATVVFAVN